MGGRDFQEDIEYREHLQWLSLSDRITVYSQKRDYSAWIGYTAKSDDFYEPRDPHA